MDVIKIKGLVQDLDSNHKYDLIISKMVLEHIEDPDAFHMKVMDILKTNGRVVHFFACRHSLPAFVNRLLPEFIGDSILKILNNRNLIESPKYKAYYRRTKGHTRTQISYFQNLGYKIENYSSFVGHKYLAEIPLMGFLERVYSFILHKLNLKQLATVALIVLKNNENIK